MSNYDVPIIILSVILNDYTATYFSHVNMYSSLASSNSLITTSSKYQPCPAIVPSCPIVIFCSVPKDTASRWNMSV